MNVAYVTFAPFISGAERSLQLMLRAAPAAGIRPIVLCPPGSSIVRWCDDNGVRVVTRPLADRDWRHPVRWAWSVARVAQTLRRERIDLVHSNQVWCMAAAGAAAALLGIPRVCHMRDEVGVEGIRWWCKAGVEAVICISQHIERRVRPAWDSLHPPRIRTLLNPVTPDDSACSGAERAESRRCARRRFGINDDATVFGFLGQLVPVKGLRELIDALALVSDGRWRLLVAGRDPHPGQSYEAGCRRRIEEMGLADRISFVGFLDDTSEFYHAIDAAIVPSLEEPLGRVPLEAAAFGLPTIAFATGGLVETIVDGDTGWLVPAGDVPALHTAVSAVVLNTALLQRAGQRARARVQMLTPQRYMHAVAAIYKDVLMGNDTRVPETAASPIAACVKGGGE